MENYMKLEVPAKSCNESFVRAVVSAFSVQLDLSIEELADIKTAVSEAVTNAVVHGYGGRGGKVRMHALCREDGLIIIDISDRGCGIADIKKAMEPFYTTLEGEERSGMGFTVMESFMDRVEVQSAVDHGTTVRLIKQLDVREE